MSTEPRRSPRSPASEGATPGSKLGRNPPRPGVQIEFLAALLSLLRESGYEPALYGESRKIYLRNCPYEPLSSDHRTVTCGMNYGWAQGVLDALADDQVVVELTPAPGRCCLIFEPA